METTEHGWTIVDGDAGIYVHEYAFAKDAFANTFVAKMANGELMVVSPAAGLREPAYAELESFGTVGAIVAPNGFHHLGQIEFRTRFPKARCFAAPETIHRIRDKNPDVGDFEGINMLPLIAGENIGIGEVENTKCGETWVWVKGAGGTVWFVSDILANMPSLPKKIMPWLLFKFTKSAPGYRPFNLALKFIVKDPQAVLRSLKAEMEKHPPTVVVPGHGPLVTGDDVAERTDAMLAAALA